MRLDGAEAGGAGDVVDGRLGRLEQPARDLDAHRLDVRGRRARRPRRGTRARSGAGSSRRVPRAARRRGRSSGCSAIHALQVAERVALGDLRAELRAELRLPARPLHEHHELPRDARARRRGRGRRSTSASARSMPAVTPADVHTLPSRTKIGSGSTVTVGIAGARGSRTPASASSRAGRRAGPRPRARTRRCTPTRPAGCARGASRPSATSASSSRRGHRAFAADDDQRVDRPAHRRAATRSATIVGPRRRASGPASRRRDRRSSMLVARPRPRREHLVRPDEVERGDPGIGDEDDAAVHRAHSAPAAVWQQ